MRFISFISDTATWVSTRPEGRMPRSLLRTARSSTSVLTRPLTNTSASPFRTIMTALAAASSSLAAATTPAGKAGRCSVSDIWEMASRWPTKTTSTIIFSTARATASSVEASEPQTTARRHRRPLCDRWAVSCPKFSIISRFGVSIWHLATGRGSRCGTLFFWGDGADYSRRLRTDTNLRIICK